MQKIIAANWKMNKIRPEAAKYAGEFSLELKNGTPQDRLTLIFPPFTDIATVADAFAGMKNLAVGGQNFYPAEHGAFTGEISCAMLRDAGATWVLTGHSERRHIFDESDEVIAKKTAWAVDHDFRVMLCIGETEKERDEGRLAEVLDAQLASAIKPLAGTAFANNPQLLAVAYEPVWAIGTGKVASTDDIAEAHAQTRKILGQLVGSGAGAVIPILYGGSVKADNAGAILGVDNVDGLLVGGASLEVKSFLDILRA